MTTSTTIASNRSKILPYVAFAALIAVAALFPLFTQKPYPLHVGILLLLAVAQGSAWNIVGGYTGQYSVGHAAYFGVGAYTVMMLLELHQIAPWWGLGLAVINALIIALIIGSITFRLRGPYFVLASIAVAEIIRLGTLHWRDFTRGAEGILLSGIPPLEVAGFTVKFIKKTPFYYGSLGLALAVIAATWAIQHSKLGYYFQAVREDQDAANSLGINLTVYKNVALAISAVFTACAGGMTALYVKFIDPNIVFGLDLSVQMVLICIIGGIGTILGPIIGALVLIPLSEILRNNLIGKALIDIGLVSPDSATGVFFTEHLSHAHVLVYGILVVLVILFAPDGILGLIQKAKKRFIRKEVAEVGQ